MTNLSDYFLGLTPVTEQYALINPGAETGDMTGWTVLTGTGYEMRSASPDPKTGSYYFAGGNQDLVASYQYIDAIQGTITAAHLDTGKVLFKVSWWESSYQASGDMSRCYATFYDGSPGNIIITGNAIPEYLQGAIGAWSFREATFFAPVGTRTVRVVMGGDRRNGVFNNSGIDDITLLGTLCA